MRARQRTGYRAALSVPSPAALVAFTLRAFHFYRWPGVEAS
jgi:hypothetical protein